MAISVGCQGVKAGRPAQPVDEHNRRLGSLPAHVAQRRLPAVRSEQPQPENTGPQAAAKRPLSAPGGGVHGRASIGGNPLFHMAEQ
jgi:hypothetical protein